jgi:hypothetical protein
VILSVGSVFSPYAAVVLPLIDIPIGEPLLLPQETDQAKKIITSEKMGQIEHGANQYSI